MGLDIRIPLGLIFLALGALLTVFGAFTHNDPTLYQRTQGVNLNLVWGSTMLIFGGIMFFVGRRQKWHDDPVNPRPWENSGQPGPHY